MPTLAASLNQNVRAAERRGREPSEGLEAPHLILRDINYWLVNDRKTVAAYDRLDSFCLLVALLVLLKIPFDNISGKVGENTHHSEVALIKGEVGVKLKQQKVP
jgi:hypothetical protein